MGFVEFNRVAFGSNNAPATFQRLVERCMAELSLKCLILDELLIFSEIFDIRDLERTESVFTYFYETATKWFEIKTLKV